MQQKLGYLLLAVVLGTAVLGCGLGEQVRKGLGAGGSENTSPNANKSITDKAVEGAVGSSQRLGIAECDDVIDALAAQANDPNDNIIVKAAKAAALSQFRNEAKRRLDSSNSNRANIAKFCRDFKASVDSSANKNANK